ncbi:MAG: hypothetical protein QOJ89_4286 [bacterium]|jgi:hypothetical protein
MASGDTRHGLASKATGASTLPPLLNANAIILCTHGGKVNPIPSQAKVLAGGAPVLCVPDLNGAPIAGCPVPLTPVTKPCTTVVAVTPPSWSMKVSVDGKPVYVSTLVGITDGVPPGALTLVFPGQVTVQG